MDFFMLYVYRVLCDLPEPNSKEFQAMTADRVRVCAEFAKRSSPLLMRLHNSTSVTQINSLPEHSRCAVTGVALGRHAGAQLVSDDFHVCLSSETLTQWFHYFRLRHFPRFVCGLVFEWLQKQPWYVHARTFEISRLMNSHWTHTYKTMYKDSVRALS